jgi:tRNA pseudouridine55 synthase
MATGVLPLMLGRYTRLAQFFSESRKVYEGEIRYGFATDTYDAEGEPVGPVCEVAPAREDIERLLPQFRGRIMQRPPAYSAKKVAGVAAYKLARTDRPVELREVEVEVLRFDLLAVEGDRARFVAEVSAGTYIRSLAHDLGQALGCGAHLSQLRRTQAGEFDLSRAVTLEELGLRLSQGQSSATVPSSPVSDNEHSDKVEKEALCAADRRTPFLHPRQILAGLPSVTASPEALAAIRNGRAANLPDFSDAPLVKLFANQHLLVAVVQRVAGTLFQPKVVLYAGNEKLPETTVW